MTLARPSPPWSPGGRGEWASVVCCLRPSAPRCDQGRRLGCQGFSAPDLQPAHAYFSYLSISLNFTVLRSGSAFHSEHLHFHPSLRARCLVCSSPTFLQSSDVFSNAIGIASNLVSDAGLPSNVEYKRQTPTPPMRSLTCLI